MSDVIRYICERYNPARCAYCGLTYYVNVVYNEYDLFSPKCDHFYPSDAKYSNKYIYYAGVTGFIALYGDFEIAYGIAADEIEALNNLHEAKTKRKL